MSRKQKALPFLICSRLFLAPPACRAAARATPSRYSFDAGIAGTWRGTSLCQVEGSPCHDEVNVYRFREIPEKPGRFWCTASKIVDGREVLMGAGSEWSYDPTKHSLETALPGASVRLTLDGDQLYGALILPDHTIYRRIRLKKEH
jgi:hypothetical protein